MSLSMRPSVLLLFLSSLCVNLSVSAQTFTIADGSGSGCEGALYDSGGQGASGYLNNENYIFTLCPDVPGNGLHLIFSTFNLDVAGPEPFDNLTIYDGDNSGAPAFGTYAGTELQNQVMNSTFSNSTGCLTFEFHSNGNGTGVFAIGFSCVSSPCEPPTAHATMSETSPAWVCAGEAVTFDGSGSFAAPGRTLVGFAWHFEPGEVDDTSGTTASHVFPEAGAYPIQLVVIDDSGCVSINSVDQLVLSSTAPHLSLTNAEQTMCVGQALEMIGTAVPTPWTGVSGADYGAGIPLPDDVGQPFRSDIVLDYFEPGATLTSATDLHSVCVDMEHSYMGDLVLEVICPNGQTTIFHQQGGGYTFVGGANDLDNDLDPQPGDCWHYCWSPTASNGTWVDNSLLGGTPNTVLGGNPPNQSLVPGTYESLQPFSNLIGCPLNGIWSFQSTDLWGADNGFLCGWSIEFDQSLGTDSAIFTPSIGPGCDSSFWTGSNITWTSQDCDSIMIAPTAPGELNFTYTVLDNFGCSYDSVVTITVLPSNDPNCMGMGIEEAITPAVILYPVPAGDELFLSSAHAIQGYELWDTEGRLLRTEELANGTLSSSIPLTELSNGLYVLVLRTRGGRYRYSVIKQ